LLDIVLELKKSNAGVRLHINRHAWVAAVFSFKLQLPHVLATSNQSVSKSRKMHPVFYFAATMFLLVSKVAAIQDQYYVRGNGITDVMYNSTLAGTYQVSSLMHCMALSTSKALPKTPRRITRIDEIWTTL
jgi:hypothetical protein